MGPVDASIIIVSFNVRAQLLRLLASLDGQAAQVIVVDNASSDGSVEAVKQYFEGVECLALANNLGFGAAANQGAWHARHQTLIFLNPDTELVSGAIKHMHDALGAFAKSHGAWAAGFGQQDAFGHLQLAWGPTPNVRHEALRKGAQRLLDRPKSRAGRWLGAIHRGLMRLPTPVSWVAASSIVVLGHRFAQLGGFDPAYFLYFEDIDLCLRIGLAGGAVIFDPTLTIIHHRGQSMKTRPDIAARAYRQSQIVFANRHLGLCAKWLSTFIASRKLKRLHAC